MTELKLHSLGDDLHVAVVGASGAIGAAMVELLAASAQVKRIYAC